MNIQSECRNRSRGKMFFSNGLRARLNRRIRAEQATHVEHVDAEGLADEVAGIVNGNIVRRRGMTGQDEDPSETVLGDLRTDIGYQRSHGSVPDAVCAR